MNISVNISGANDLPLPEQTLAVQPPPTPRCRTRKVLVVDDEDLILEIAVAYIENMGHTALRATHAATALEIIRCNPDISLVMTDVLMPGLSGLELIQAIRHIRPMIKVVYVSGFAPEVITQRAGTRTHDLMLRKPFQQPDLHAVIRKAFAAEEDTALTGPL